MRTLIISAPAVAGHVENWMVGQLHLQVAGYITYPAIPATPVPNTIYPNDIIRAHAEHVVKETHDFLAGIDCIFFADALCPAAEKVRQRRHGLPMIGWLHGHSSLAGDLILQPNHSWLLLQEHSILSSFDMLWTSTQAVVDSVVAADPTLVGKVVAVGQPVQGALVARNPEVAHVAWASRLDDDKGAMLLVSLIQKLPSIQFTVMVPVWDEGHVYQKWLARQPNVTISVCRNRYDVIEAARNCSVLLNCAVQETWGYSILDGAVAGCVPLMRANLNAQIAPADCLVHSDDVDEWAARLTALCAKVETHARTVKTRPVTIQGIGVTLRPQHMWDGNPVISIDWRN